MQTILKAARESIDSGQTSAKELALLCDCSRQHIYQILNEKQHPTAPLLEKLANALGLEITVKKSRSRKKVVA